MRDPYDDALDSLEAAETQAPALQVASAAQPAEPDIYDAAFDKVEREEAEALRPMLDLATRTAPDVFASAQALAKSSGLPVELVERNLEEVKRAEQIKLASRVLEASPTLRRQMADPNFTRLAHEDVEQLGAIERIVKGAKEAGGSMVAGLYGASSGVVGVGQFAAEMAQYVTRPLHGALLPIDVGGAVADAARSYRRGIEAEAAQWRPERGGVLSQGWHSGLESLARNLPGLPLLFLPGGATASLTGMTLPVAGEEYGKARDRGLGVLEAGVFGASQGLVEYATERLPMTKLMGDIAAGTGLGKMLAKQFVYEAPTEQLATVLQDLNQWAALDINEGKTFGDYARERPEAAAVTLIATLVGTTGQTTIVHGMQKTLERLAGGQTEAEQSQRLADAARELAAASQALRLSQLSPDTVEEYLQAVTEGGLLEELYVGADVLEQLGLTQRMAEASPAIAEQLAAVGQDGGMIRITAAELAAKLGPAGLADPLFDHLRPGRPDAMSKLEAEEYLQTLGERMEEELSADLGDVDQRVADDFDLNAYRDYVVAQLQALGRPDLAPAYRAYGELQKAMIGALASRAGLTPRQLLERRGLLAITGEGQAAPERSPAQPTLEDLEQDYWDVRVEWERVNAEGGDIEAADAAVEAARRRVEEARRRSAQDAGGADASAAAGSQMGRARSALDEARSAFDLAYQAGEDLTGAMESIRAATADLAREIAAGYPDATGFLADRIDGGRIELEQVRDEGGQLIDSWVVTWRDEQGATERDDVFASREDALDAYLADAKLDGMEFFTLAAAESAPTPVSRLTELREAAEAAAAEVAAFEAATDQGQEIDPDAYWAATERQVEANRALAAELEALPDDGFALEAVTPGGMALSLTPSAQQPGKWQLTHFDQAGQPWGDTQYETKAEAIAELLTDADVSTVRDFGGQFNQRARPFGGEEVARTPIGDVTEIDVDGEMRPALNSAGRPIHPTIEGVRNFWRWFGDSQVVDAQGRPLVLYHASAREFDQSNRTFWGFANPNGANAYAAMRAEAGNAAFVMPVYLSSSRTFDADALDTASSFDYPDGLSVGRFIDQLIGQSGASGAVRDRLQEIARELKKHAKTQESGPTYSPENFWYTQHFYFGFEGQKLIEEAFRLAGFDGLKFTEQVHWFDGDAYQSSGELSFAAFSPSQIKSATGNRGAFDPNEPNILYQREAPQLQAVHNLSAENLLFADELGGLAVPSVGVVRADAGAVDGFGEITLIGTRGLVDPKRERAFAGDAYTARFPKPSWSKVKTKPADKIVESIREAADEFGDRTLVGQTWDALVNTPDAGELVELWLRSNAVRAMYLRERGIDAAPVMRDVPMRTPVPAGRLEELRPLFDAVNVDQGADVLDSPEWAALAEAYARIVGEAYAEKGRPDSLVAKLAEFNYRRHSELALDLKNAGKQEVDTWKTTEALSAAVDPMALDFKRWIEARVLPAFGEPFLLDGKKKKPYTLENIVASMTDKKVKGKETSATYGAGQAKAAVSVEFSDLEQMRAAAAESIVDPAEFEAARAQTDALLEAYRNAVAPFTTIRNWRGEPDVWEAMDASMRALARFSTGKKRDAAAMRQALKREEFDVAAISDEAIEQAIVAADALMRTPVPYFEAKPQRAVRLDEFAGAVIPDNAPAEVRAILDRHGLPVREYAAEGDRTAAVRAFAAELNASGAETLFQGATPIGGYVPATNTMRMLKSANLSTFLHETGHMGLEMMIDLAGSISSYPADQLSEGEKGILRDVNAVLAWFGVRDLAEWSAMSFQEKRGYHEKFAESFERYLLEGKAPSVELQPFFGKFRRWMLDVYKSVKSFLQKNPDAGELSDEVRQVFDRMLATDEQIDTLRRLGTLSALFSSAEQAEALGIQIEDWDAYQALASGQIDEAKELMSERALRDMKWLSRARSRELRKLQKEAALLRAGVEMEVRPDVLRRPIYRAWQFLTARMGEDDRLPNIERPKSDPDVVDPALDSLFVAIAKLGGIDRAELESEWGLDPKEKIPQAGFGKHVLRRTGGRSIDEMRALLVQYGYLDPNETGPDWNPREFEERFFEELNGSAQYSSAADFDALQDIRPGDQVINLAGLSAGRFDAAALQSMGLPADVLERMRKLRMTSSNGLHPDIVADMLVDPDGVALFESGDQLVRELAAAPTPSEQIAAEVDAIMLERHGEFATREALEDAVDAAVHNNLRLRLIATQYAALTKARGDVELIQRAARDVAKRMVSRKAIKALRPDLFRAAEARAAKASERAIQAGDVETAAKEQRNQLVNAYAVREAIKAKEDIAKTIKAWKELVGRSDKRAAKSYDVDVLNAVRVILGAYGIGGKQAEKAGEYLERVKAYDPELYAVLNDYASRLAAADMVKPVGELKIEQFEELKEGIGAMLELARSSRTAEIGGDTMDIADIQAELVAKAEENGIPDRIPGEGMAVTPSEAKLQKLKSALAAATRMEQWVDMFDAVTGVGPARRYLFMHVNSAANNYRADKVKYLRKFRELIDPIASTLGPKLIHSDELGYTFGKDTGGSAVNEILHALLHTGNSSNKRKLLLGRGWAKEVAPGVLDTSSWDAFVRRMADEGHITKEHMDFVQGVWDLLEETKPLAQKAHRAIFGLYFAEVTAEPVSTPWGVYRGGYVPAIVDTRANADASLRAMAEDETQSMSFAFPSPASGFTKSRVEYNAQLLLDLRSITQHIDKVLMFAHMAKPVRDVKRMIGGDFGKALGRINKEVIPGVITPFLNRSAKQIVATPIPGDGGLMGFFATLRSRAGMAAMIANLTNTAQQVTGFSLSALKVKPTLMLSAAAQFVQSPREFIASVTSASIAMDHRFNNSGALVGDQISEILLNPSLLERGQAFGMRHAYFMQAGVDAVMSSIIWTAAYNQAVERGSPHDDAVALADSTIRTTQGSMLPEDLARFEAGNHFVRLFTQFAGYFNMQANLITSELVKRGRSIKREGWTKDNVAGVSKVLLLAFLIPAVVAELIVQAFRGGPDDEDKDGEYLDDWLAYAGMGVIRNATAMVPVVGQLANAIYSRTNSKPYDDRVGTNPAFSMIESAASAPFSIAKAVADDGSSQKAIRETGIAISMILGLPVTPLTKPLGYAAAVEEGRVNPTSAGDYARGIVTGVASPESK